MIENRVLAARHGAPRMRHLQIPCLPLATEAAMELRLIEQACGCSTVVRDGGGLTGRCSSVLAIEQQKSGYALKHRIGLV